MGHGLYRRNVRCEIVSEADGGSYRALDEIGNTLYQPVRIDGLDRELLDISARNPQPSTNSQNGELL